eukprot:1196131-Prorocentrum_minimum.AAC.13
MQPKTAAFTRTETQSATRVGSFTNPGEFPEGVGTPELTRGNRSHGRLQPRGDVGSRRGEAGLAESALPASPSSQEG